MWQCELPDKFPHTYNSTDRQYVRTQEISYGRKTNEIEKFSVLDEETKFAILDEKWPTDGKKCLGITKKNCKDIT